MIEKLKILQEYYSSCEVREREDLSSKETDFISSFHNFYQLSFNILSALQTTIDEVIENCSSSSSLPELNSLLLLQAKLIDESSSENILAMVVPFYIEESQDTLPNLNKKILQ